ncbi:MAG: inositol 2-dehydrogenase, partial [Rhizobiaceae bacterium]|nr:inositol 2-dehydrogenase [Rhizobiaceae bacterium]
MTIQFALLGAGRIGQVHAQAVTSNRNASLIAVADVFADAANALIASYG